MEFGDLTFSLENLALIIAVVSQYTASTTKIKSNSDKIDEILGKLEDLTNEVNKHNARFYAQDQVKEALEREK